MMRISPWLVLAVITTGLALACAGPDPTATPTSAGPDALPTPAGQDPPPPTADAPGEPTPQPEATFDAEAYFSGMTIVVVDGFPPGGTSDTLARMFAQVAPRHFPGSPRFLVRNVAGGGGLRGLEYTLRSDPNHPSELILGMVHSRWVYRTIAGQPTEGFDLAETKWLGVPNLSASTNALYVRRDVATSWQEVLDSGRSITVGAPAPGSSSAAGPEFLAAVGGPINMLFGYGGTAEVMAAFARGELEGTGNPSRPTVERLYPELIEQQFHVPLFWWGAAIDDDYREYLALLNAEEPVHLYDTWPVTDEQTSVFEVLQSPLGSSTSFLHPGVSDEVYAAVQEAWENTMQDPQFIELKLAGGQEAEYVTAQDVRDIIDAALALSPEGVELFRILVGIE